MQRTSRRRFIRGIGAVGATGIAAGCNADGSNDGSGESGGSGGSSNGETAGGGADGDSGDKATTVSGGSEGSTTVTRSSTSGATESGGSGVTTIASGPNGKLVFDPEQVEISVGDTVVWEFESAGHNVSARPQDSEKVSIPSDAKPFASYENGDTYAVVPEGKTYEYTFETPGKYTYVCIPHVSSGMIGTITVTE